jgi:hypothetical protein
MMKSDGLPLTTFSAVVPAFFTITWQHLSPTMTSLEPNLKDSGIRSDSRAEYKPLLETATKDLFRKNAFRLLGLRVDATVREVSKQGVKMKQMEELGMGNSTHAAAFPLSPPPSQDDLRAAIQRLQDPEKRLVDEFFWFWPEQFGTSHLDAAIDALQAGDSETAVKVWTLRESDPAHGLVAMHNIAVLWHMTALESEHHTAACDPGEDSEARLNGFWTKALRRWERLIKDELFWESFHDRVQQINDPRLTSGFVHRFRLSLPESIAKINGELALHYAEAGQPRLAATHASLMRETNRGLLDVERAAQWVLVPASHRLKELISTAQRCSAANPADGAGAAQELAEQAAKALPFFDLICGANSRFRIDLFDEVAAVCNRIQLAYDQKTGDEKRCIEILKTVLPFTTFASLRQPIAKNIDILTRRLAQKQRPRLPRPPRVRRAAAQPGAATLKPPVLESAHDPKLRIPVMEDNKISRVTARNVNDQKLSPIVKIVLTTISIILIGHFFRAKDPGVNFSYTPSQQQIAALAPAPVFPLVQLPAAPITYRIPDSQTNQMAHDLQVITEQTAKVTGLREEERKLHSQLTDARLPSGPERSRLTAQFNQIQLDLDRETASLKEITAGFKLKWQTYAQ